MTRGAKRTSPRQKSTVKKPKASDDMSIIDEDVSKAPAAPEVNQSPDAQFVASPAKPLDEDVPAPQTPTSTI